MMQLVIHAGPHKTGTTSFQVACAEASPALLDFGILYPKTGVDGRELTYGGSHTDLALAMRNRKKQEVGDYSAAHK
jgi:hypothetical protein